MFWSAKYMSRNSISWWLPLSLIRIKSSLAISACNITQRSRIYRTSYKWILMSTNILKRILSKNWKTLKELAGKLQDFRLLFRKFCCILPLKNVLTATGNFSWFQEKMLSQIFRQKSCDSKVVKKNMLSHSPFKQRQWNVRYSYSKVCPQDCGEQEK